MPSKPRMKRAIRKRLSEDVAEFGIRALAGETATEIGFPRKRHKRLRDWVETYGLADPMDFPDVSQAARAGAVIDSIPEPWEETQAPQPPPQPKLDPLTRFANELRQRNGLPDNLGGREWEMLRQLAADEVRTELNKVRALRIMVVGDTHTEPGQDLRRFDWLGRACAELKVDAVVLMGDHWTNKSLCTHSSRREKEGARYADELEHGLLALDRVTEAADGYVFDKYLLGGNHDEGRWQRTVGDNPYLEGLVDLGGEVKKRGWKWVPFLEPLRLAKVRFQHYIRNRGGRAAQSATGVARAALTAVGNQESVVVGHCHTKSTWRVASPLGHVRLGLSAGCYFEHIEEYAGDQSNANWWRGLILLRNVFDGDYDITEFRMDTVRQRWGSS